jgi:hypothetical protein
MRGNIIMGYKRLDLSIDSRVKNVYHHLMGAAK